MRLGTRYCLIVGLVALLLTCILLSCSGGAAPPIEEQVPATEELNISTSHQPEQDDYISVPESRSSSNSAQSFDSQPIAEFELPKTASKFVGSINSDKYHYPECLWAKKIYPENEIWFNSAEAAQAKGYVPCKVCNPPQPNSATQSLSDYELPAISSRFVGSINSNKYHYPDCVWAKKIYPENEIWFDSVAEAQNKGYVPCKVCNPPD